MSTESELESWREEKQSSYLYRVLADCEPADELKRLFIRLAGAADAQSLQWEKFAADRGVSLPKDFTPSTRARLVAGLLRRLGPRHMLPVLAAMKVRGLSVYTQGAPTGHDTPAPGQREFRHRRMGSSGSFRAAVFGINDGLVSNVSLIMGVAGASLDSHVILLTGAAGMLAGAASMGVGEYISMQSQREMFEHQIGLEQQELNAYPEEEAEELALIYEARGIPAADAKRLAHTLISDPKRALDTLAREELGLNPHELGSPWGAAGASFLSFALGAVVPLLPFTWHAENGVAVSVGITAVMLFLTGNVVSLFTGQSTWLSGLRMVGVAAVAAGVTYLVGHLFGVALS